MAQPNEFYNSSHQSSFDVKLRIAMRTRIYAILKQKLSESSFASHEKLVSLTTLVEAKLKQITSSKEDYSDLRFLESRIWSIVADFRRKPPRPPITTTTAPPSNNVVMTSQPEHMHMDFAGSSMSNVGSSNLYGAPTTSASTVVPQDTIPLHPNDMLRVDPNAQVNQQTPLLKRQRVNKQNMVQGSQQVLLDHGFHQQARDLGKQGQLQYKDDVDGGHKPSILQFQQNVIKYHYTSARSASSPSFPPHPHQRQPSLLSSCQTTPTQPQALTLTDRIQDYMKQRKWLLFMFHARDCNNAAQGQCMTKFCLPAKQLLDHMQRCKLPHCSYPLCPQTRKLLLHYKGCKNKSCPVCVFVKNFKKKQKATTSLLSGVKRSRSSLRCQTRMEAYKKDTPCVDDDLRPCIKRLKIEAERSSVPLSNVVCKPHLSLDKHEKNVGVDVMPMDIDFSDAYEILVTREHKNLVDEDISMGRDGGEFFMDDKNIGLSPQVGVPKEDYENQHVDASNMEIPSLVELFTPEQAKEHMRSLRQWSRSKAEKNKAIGRSMSMNACQLCSFERLTFEPMPIYCSPCGIRIKRKAFHYSVAADESRHYVCATCYNVARDNVIAIDGTSIPKLRFEKKKQYEQASEGWVQCDKCQAWQHQICALFNNRRNNVEVTKYTCPNCYIQEMEQGERKPLPESVIPGAKSLPVSNLSNHIEQRLFKNLKKERQERARLEGKTYEEVRGAESLVVRVVASVDKVLQVKEHFHELFREGNYPTEFPYKSKAILLFQEIEGVEVLLFGMFVQEYGSECGPPNQRRVYLSYLDSVKYFRPADVRTVSGEALRTFVYHEILIGYLDYCKNRGFASCYIWTCPPLKGEDYILYCHPEIQKTPKTDKLREWYLAMLRKASKEDVVVEYTNLYDQFFVQHGECSGNVTAARLPYFDGDYWPGLVDDLIKQMSREDDMAITLNRKGLTKNYISKRDLREVEQLDLSVNASKDRLIMQKLGEIICPIKEDFIMVHLQHCCKTCCATIVSGNRWVCNECEDFHICDKCNEVEQNCAEKERHPMNHKKKHMLFPVAVNDIPIETEDKDDNLESEFFENRQAFLSLCQGNNYQYDTLRRAKHSSMMILYHLHNPTAPAFATTCALCQQEVENGQGWHCEVCTSYDVCNDCFSKTSIDHPHKLISKSSAMETTVQQSGKANHQLQHQKIEELLVHITACRFKQCQYEGCQRTKGFVKHCIACKISNEGCPHCKKFWGIIKYHARSCRDSQCTVLKCRDFRAVNSRQQQQSDKRRRAAVMEMMRERADQKRYAK